MPAPLPPYTVCGVRWVHPDLRERLVDLVQKVTKEKEDPKGEKEAKVLQESSDNPDAIPITLNGWM